MSDVDQVSVVIPHGPHVPPVMSAIPRVQLPWAPPAARRACPMKRCATLFLFANSDPRNAATPFGDRRSRDFWLNLSVELGVTSAGTLRCKGLMECKFTIAQQQSCMNSNLTSRTTKHDRHGNGRWDAASTTDL
ncbi:hypothetical protein AVEN_212213-1 [Araneus ventricosus]|uniref:Uncharacterized protein n=1 Tax=Araneus ventricosus TaxID=182803 RepID=A0A4Y2HTS6_ARAVE|nr:hypothetical protein AVEN_212213-1 [Araneus ventricosus]